MSTPNQPNGPPQEDGELNIDLPEPEPKPEPEPEPRELYIETIDRASITGIELGQEWIRGFLAIAFAAVFTAVVLIPLAFIDTWPEAREWLQAALPAVTALLGSAMGFYFGQRNTRDRGG